MLAIKKRHRIITVVSAGSFAFAIGLSGAAAYVGSNIAHQNLTFSKEQTSASRPTGASSTDNGTVTVDGKEKSGSGLYAPQNSFAESPMINTTSGSQISVSPTTTTEQVTDTTVQTQPTTTDTSGELLPLCTDLPLLTAPVPGSNCRI